MVRRAPLLHHCHSTLQVAELIKHSGEHYGSSLPDLPGAGKNAINAKVCLKFSTCARACLQARFICGSIFAPKPLAEHVRA